ncbi:MAG: phage minor head protein [Mariprofundaceae bacterium]|nr:phage minor head protein [Mariprofundaceae bacterium]
MKGLPFVEAIAWAKAQGVVLPDTFYGERMAQARANARTISGLAGVDQIQSVFDKLDKVLKNGGTFAAFKKSVLAGDVGLGLPTHRLELIYRNNIQSAYMAGRWQQVEQNKDNRPYLQYSAINDGRTRPSHRKMHGFIARVDDKIWHEWMPLNGHRCRCSVRSLSEKQAKALGISDKANGKPDAGWDYNAGKKPSEGLKKSAKHKKTVVDGRLGGAVEKAVTGYALPVNIEQSKIVLNKFVDDALAKPRRVKKRASVHVGDLSTSIQAKASITTAKITLTVGAIEHMLRLKKENRGQALSKGALASLAIILHEPKAVLLDLRDGDLLYIFDVAGEHRLGKIVIRPNYLEKQAIINSIRTGGLVDINKLKDDNVYKIIEGSL